MSDPTGQGHPESGDAPTVTSGQGAGGQQTTKDNPKYQLMAYEGGNLVTYGRLTLDGEAVAKLIGTVEAPNRWMDGKALARAFLALNNDGRVGQSDTPRVPYLFFLVMELHARGEGRLCFVFVLELQKLIKGTKV